MLSFFAGLFIGGVVGVITMCIVVVGKRGDEIARLEDRGSVPEEGTGD